MFPSICPLCQEVCQFNQQLLQYRCDHYSEDFHYSAIRPSKKRNYKCSEITFKTSNYILTLNFKSNFSYIFDFESDKSYSVNTIIPIDWNTFDIDTFEQKIVKITQLKAFS